MSASAAQRRADECLLARFGETVTITPPLDSFELFGPVDIIAVYDERVEAALPLDGSPQATIRTLLADDSTLTGVDVTCTATVRGSVHGIVSVDPAGGGMSTILLGDAP